MIAITKTSAIILVLLLVSHRHSRQVFGDAFQRVTGIHLDDFETNTVMNMGYNLKLRIPRQEQQENNNKDEL